MKIQNSRDEAASADPRRELLVRCCEASLQSGSPLPDIFTEAEKQWIPGLIQPQWVGPEALRNLDRLGLGEKSILRILDMLLNGMIPFPESLPLAGPVAAALELSRPTEPRSAEALARRTLCLYEQNERFLKLRPPAWLALLDDCATMALSQPPATLECVLGQHPAAQWLVAAGLGVPLLKMVEAVLPAALPGWELRSIEFALASARLPNRASVSGPGNMGQPIAKVEVIDGLISEPRLSFENMLNLVRGEIEAAFRDAMSKLDRSRPLALFGDHGFRLAVDGQSFSYDGTSTLEGIIPVFILHPSA